MKNISRITACLAVAALFTLTAFAQDPAPSPEAPPECEKAKGEEYMKWRESRAGDAAQQKVAYEAGKAFLAKCPNVDDAYVNAVKKWNAKYEEAVVKFETRKKFEDAVKALEAAQGTKNYRPLFAAGKDLLAAEPENLAVLLTLTNAGVLNSTAGQSADKSLDPEAISAARRALALIESGKGTPEELKQLSAANKEEAVIALDYRLGILNRGTAPAEAANQLLKVAQGNSALKSEPALYFYLAQAYTDGDYKKLVTEYQQKFPEGQEIPEERKAEYDQYQARLNQVADRIIDAYARAAALLEPKTDAASAEFRKLVMSQLTNLWKQRHEGSDAELGNFIKGSATRRLPLPTDPPPTPPPAPTPTPTPTPATTPPERRG